MSMPGTPVAVLGTLADFHREPIPYNLSALMRYVERLRPDLLCLDMTPEEWKTQDFASLPPEYREALVPLAQQTDIVVIPVADERPRPEVPMRGWRASAAEWIKRALASLQRTASSPEAINQGIRHELANLLYHILADFNTKDARESVNVHASRLARNVSKAARRDPGRRILVVVNVRFCHLVRRSLRSDPEVHVVRYQEL